MCTAISLNKKHHFFGRNLDLEKRYRESITIMPRNYIIKYRNGFIEQRHYAMIGTATVTDNYPLYYDATNEFGLSIAGLNFVGNAFLNINDDNKINLAPYELIPFLLGKSKTVNECEKLIKKINLVDIPFSEGLQNSELHWLIADKNECIVLEIMREGIKIHKNPVGILTNNPPFEYQMMNLNNYINLTAAEPTNRFSKALNLKAYSKGMGAIGIPGDLSSMSRFVRASFTKLNAVIPDDKTTCMNQMFHILASVEQPEGSVKVGDKFERTQYSSCCDMDECIYYYRTYENSRINAIKMYSEDVECDHLISYIMSFECNILYIN